MVQGNQPTNCKHPSSPLRHQLRKSESVEQGHAPGASGTGSLGGTRLYNSDTWLVASGTLERGGGWGRFGLVNPERYNPGGLLGVAGWEQRNLFTLPVAFPVRLIKPAQFYQQSASAVACFGGVCPDSALCHFQRHHPRRNSGLCHVCTGGKQHKAQKENGLVSGL